MTVPTVPFQRPHPLSAPPGLADLYAKGPIQRVLTPVGDEAWLVTGHEPVKQFLMDDRFGRSHPDPQAAGRTGESVLFGGPTGDFETEQADHARMRSLLQPLFSPKLMRAFRPRVETLTTELLDAMEAKGSPADVHQALALPLPILVICELLGVPYEDRERFRAWSEEAGNVRDRARSEKGLGDLFAYGMDLVARKRKDPADDVISRLAATEGVSDGEAAMTGMVLLFAGHETTVVAIGTGLLQLTANPEQRQALLSDPSLIGAAVEEMLRGPSPNGSGIPRYAREDVEIHGVKIAQGDLVLIDAGSANHDDAVFADAARFDISRPASPHFTFGQGARYCIGAPLARIELQVVFSQLIPRFPEMRLTVPLEQIPLRRDVLTEGPSEIPVAW